MAAILWVMYHFVVLLKKLLDLLGLNLHLVLRSKDTEESEQKRWNAQNKGGRQRPVVWSGSATGAAAWWRDQEHLWTSDTWLMRTTTPHKRWRWLSHPNLGCSCCPAEAAWCWAAPAKQPGSEGSPPLQRNTCVNSSSPTHALITSYRRGWTLTSWHQVEWCGQWTGGPDTSAGPRLHHSTNKKTTKDQQTQLEEEWRNDWCAHNGLTLLVEALHSFPLVARIDQSCLNPGQSFSTLTTNTNYI